MITIRTKDGEIRTSVEVTEASVYSKTLMEEEYVQISFVSDAVVPLAKGDYIDTEHGVFMIVYLSAPTRTSTGGYQYEQKFHAHWERWRNRITFYDRQKGSEKAWKMTQSPEYFMDIIAGNIHNAGYGEYTWDIDGTLTDMKLVEFDATNILDALTKVAEAWQTEWWVTDRVLHLSKCEYGTPVTLAPGDIVTGIQTNTSQDSTYFTRIYAFGSTRNLPQNYRKGDDNPTIVEGVVERRLKLPDGVPYVDAWPDLDDTDVVEGVAVFDDVYPHMEGKIASVTTKEYTDKTENEDGTTTTKKWNAYRFTDNGIKFSKNYIIDGEELRMVFQSGKLAGMDFGVAFNPDGKAETEQDAQLFEIIRNEDYGIALPSDDFKPEVGDTYILYGYDTKFVNDELVGKAENELLKAAKEYIKTASQQEATWVCPTNPVRCTGYMEQPDGTLKHFGDKEINLDVGQMVTLQDGSIFNGGTKTSRVYSFEKRLDNKFNATYTIGESNVYSKRKDLTDKVDALTYVTQKITNAYGSTVYLIKRYDNTAATDTNTYSALRLLSMFFRKDAPDETPYLVRLLGGLHVGEAVSSITAGKGALIDERGNAEVESLKVRSFLEVMELVFNRLNAREGDQVFTDNGLIEAAALEEDGTYTLTLHKRWENDFTSFQVGDVVRGIVNNLASGSGEYYTAWMRVLAVDRAANSVSVNVYPDNEVPAGKNFPPVPMMALARWGNAIENSDGTYNTRQSAWYLSSDEGRIVFHTHVTKPIIEDGNYGLSIGLLPELEAFKDKAVNYDQPYIYAKGVIAEDVMELDYQGNVVRKERFRGEWSAKTAVTDPYTVTATTVDVVYHNGCKWQCLVSGTRDEPRYGSTGWVMVEGNKAFTVQLDSSNGWAFYPDQLDTVLTVTCSIYNEDVTGHILDKDVAWTRDSGDVTDDNAWAAEHAADGKSLHITVADRGRNYLTTGGVRFTATVLLRDGEGTVTARAMDYVMV